MLHFLRLIRWSNLLIVAASIFIVWLALSTSSLAEFIVFLDERKISLLVIATLLIAAAGYIINDYFDVRIDAINRPDTLLISNKISRRHALVWHSVFSLMGIAIYLFLAWKLRAWPLAFVGVFSTTMLWFYSTHFKKMPVLGNVVVALLTAVSIFQIAAFEPALWRYAVQPWFIFGQVNPFWLLLGISVFAFLLNWMREIVKDMEDIEGDANENCKTYPIIYGLKAAGRFVNYLGVILLMLLVFAATALSVQKEWLIALCILVPAIHCFYLMRSLPRRATTAHYSLMSRHLKIIMVEGLALIFLVNLI